MLTMHNFSPMKTINRSIIGPSVALPELELWGAVLEHAIENLHRRGAAGVEDRACIQESARQWFTSTERGIGSFLWICEVLSLDPSVTKRAAFRPKAIYSTERHNQYTKNNSRSNPPLRAS